MKFWTMVAHYHGQVWNGAEPARSLGISESSVRRYLDVLTDACMVRRLRPWHANLKKRRVKAPKESIPFLVEIAKRPPQWVVRRVRGQRVLLASGLKTGLRIGPRLNDRHAVPT
jgi:hypothetical protein